MDMDIDMDIDLAYEDHRMESEHHPEPHSTDFGTSIELPQDPISEHSSDDIIPILDKVHIRGLDNLSSSNVKKYAGEHYPLDSFVRIEWIDDTSANILYDSAQAAAEALISLSNAEALSVAIGDIPTTQLRPAKNSVEHPASKLFVRQSTSVDVKKKGAHDASRYYLLNPDQDPWERKKQQDSRRGRPRLGSDDEGDYNRRRFDDKENKRRRQYDNGFDVNMYDDEGDNNAGPGARDERRKRARLGRNGQDLFGDRHGDSVDGRLRNRSASPDREGNGLMGFESGDDNTYRERPRRARRLSHSPDRHRPTSSKNSGKELFPSLGGQDVKPSATKELFPSKSNVAGLRSSVELFPYKRQSFSNHRRSYAVDASSGVGDTAEFFVSSATPPPPGRERSLADRITGRPATAIDDIRVRGVAAEQQGMAIKGIRGVSIRGAATSEGNERELFPLKAGSNNAGKELFGEKISVSRRKAGDTYL